MLKEKIREDEYVVTQNACKLCTPLGASFVFKGIEGAVSFMHGSQGCSTYIRRYMISHFKEPIDIASSNFSEEAAVFGGTKNLSVGLKNIIDQYNPSLIGVSTTCLSETIGDDLSMFLKDFKKEYKGTLPEIVITSTASYRGTHIDGFHSAVLSTVENLAEGEELRKGVNLFPSMISPSDIRYLKYLMSDFNLEYTLLPDYSKSLDGGLWEEYEKIPKGGTSLSDIKRTGGRRLSIEFGDTISESKSAGKYLSDKFSVKSETISLPIGIDATDRFFSLLEETSEMELPEKYKEARLRLIDAYADAHKYLYGVRAVVYGEEDLAIALSYFLCEIGVKPIVIASGGKSGVFEKKLKEKLGDLFSEETEILSGADFVDIDAAAERLGADIMIGNSKGYKTARRLNIPIVRVGFPVHDRFGASRIRMLSYSGTQELFDRVVNAIIEKRQEKSPVGYTYL